MEGQTYSQALCLRGREAQGPGHTPPRGNPNKWPGFSRTRRGSRARARRNVPADPLSGLRANPYTEHKWSPSARPQATAPHGERRSYQAGCDCDACRAAEATYRATVRLVHRAGKKPLGPDVLQPIAAVQRFSVDVGSSGGPSATPSQAGRNRAVAPARRAHLPDRLARRGPVRRALVRP